MKRFVCLLLALCLSLSGCGLSRDGIKEPVTFYYLQTEYRYGVEDGVIGTEEREASGHRDNLSYLLTLYLIGPTDESLTSPIPKGTHIFSVEQEGNEVQLQLTDTSQTLTDSGYTLACACLTLTCLSITEAESVTITSGSRSVTMTRDSLTLFDGSAAVTITEETQ